MEADTRIDVRGLREFFRDTVHDALVHQKVQVDDHTEHYVVNLLTEFARANGCSSRPRTVRVSSPLR